MKVLVLGSGGREHALVQKMTRDGHHVYALPGNPGTMGLWSGPQDANPPTLNQPEALATYAKKHGFDLTVVGPEGPLAQGIVDVFCKQGLQIFGPTQKAAQLESSKAFAKTFMFRNGVPTAAFQICTNLASAKEAAWQFITTSGGVVIKPSGLTAGKGVVVCKCMEQADCALDAVFIQRQYGEAASEVVIEECLEGTEISLQVLCDGSTMMTLPVAQDHKRLRNGGEGPNTGGMGAFCPSPVMDLQLAGEIQSHILDTTMMGLRKEGIDYRGVLYFGIMLTAQGPRVLEFNCRFGDPEAQVVLPILQSDLAYTLLACSQGNLRMAPPVWSGQYACTVVLTSDGYPGHYEMGHHISGMERVRQMSQVTAYHAGTKQIPTGELLTNGGRVLGITAVDDCLASAIRESYSAARLIHFEGAHMRTGYWT